MTTDKPVESNKEQQPVLTPATVISAKPAQPRRWFVISLCVALIAIAASVYLWQQSLAYQQSLQQSRIDISAAIQRLDSQLEKQQQLQRQLDQQQDAAKRQLQTSNQQINNLQQQLASQKKRLMAMSTTDRDDWLLAEAEYLIRLANQRLLMGKEIAGASKLLTAADEIIRELDDSALYAVRQALAVDREALRVAGKLDIEGIYLQLGAIVQQVGQLTLVSIPQLTIQETEVTVPEDWQQRLERGFDGALNKLSQYVQINRRDEIYQPLLSPEYESAVRQNIQLMFEQAQMAVLSGKQKLYDDSLAKAKLWLQRYYTLDQQTINHIIAAIDQQAVKTITLELPDISGSLRALKEYQQLIHPPQPLPATDTEAVQ